MKLPYSTYDAELIARDIRHIRQDRGSAIVSIWGASGSGKTHLAKMLHNQLADSRVLSVDSYLSQEQISGTYYHDDRFANCIEGINPNIWDQDRLNEDLVLARKGEEISVPRFDHKTRMRMTQDNKLARAAITIVEGAYSYENVITDNIDMLVLVDASLHERFTRKLIRLIHRTGRTDIDESIVRYLTKTQPSLERYWDVYLSHASAVYKNSYTPERNITDLELRDDIATPNTYISLSPKQGYGALCGSEKLDFTLSGPDVRLRYSIGKKAVLDHVINTRSIDAILEYYDEEKK